MRMRLASFPYEGIVGCNGLDVKFLFQYRKSEL